MKIRDMRMEGHYEEVAGRTVEAVNLLVPENDIERDLVSWSILSMPQTVSDDSARRDYVFHYELGEEIEEGLYRLRITARDASGKEHAVDIAAALTSTLGSTEPGLHAEFIPMWFINKRILFKRPGESAGGFPGSAFGRLDFAAGPESLPQRRLFGALV